MGAAQDRVSHRNPVLPAEDVPVRRPPRARPSLGEGGFADTTALPRDQTEDSSTRLVLHHHNSFSGDIRAVFQVMGHAAVLLSPPQSPWQQGGCCSLCLVFAPAGAPRLVRTNLSWLGGQCVSALDLATHTAGGRTRPDLSIAVTNVLCISIQTKPTIRIVQLFNQLP